MGERDVKVIIEQRSNPQLRKLARALISLAKRQLDEQAKDQKKRSGEAA